MSSAPEKVLLPLPRSTYQTVSDIRHDDVNTCAIISKPKYNFHSIISDIHHIAAKG